LHIPDDQFDRSDTGQLLSRHRDNCSKLRAMVSCLGKAIIDFAPDAKGGWSIREHVIHVADTQARTFVAYRRLVADGDTEVDLGYDDHDDFTRLVKYDSLDLEDSLEVVEILGRVMANHMSQMTDQQMEGSRTNQSQRTITVKRLLWVNVLHLEDHLAQIERNLDLCAEVNGGTVWLL